MNNRGVYFKLLFLVGVSILAVAGLGLYGIYNTWSTHTWVEKMHGTTTDFQRGALEITNPLNRLRQLSLSVVLAPDAKLRSSFLQEQEEITGRLDATLEQWNREGRSRQQQDAFQGIVASWERYKKAKDFTAGEGAPGLPRGSVHQRQRRRAPPVRRSHSSGRFVDAG